eukprot:scaffold212793_cov17-Tisochrysis_lutea.AAC.1
MHSRAHKRKPTAPPPSPITTNNYQQQEQQQNNKNNLLCSWNYANASKLVTSADTLTHADPQPHLCLPSP